MSNRNPVIARDASYVGLYYAFLATGGYQIEEGLKSITLLPQNQILRYETTDSLQVKFDVRTFNRAIGIIKDASNQNILDTSFNQITNTFPINGVTLTASQFVSGMTENQIISIGKLKYVYSDFITYANSYFGYPSGFSTLFTISSQIDINGGVFDASEFINVIHGTTLNQSTGEYIKDLSGSISLSYINDLLDSIVAFNTFNNRTYPINKKDGFIEGDVIFIPNGITITLNLTIIPNLIGLNTLGQSNLANLNSVNVSNGYFSIDTITTDTSIKRVVKAPLLIKLMNLT